MIALIGMNVKDVIEMTDNEIIKALKCCIGGSNCGECPLLGSLYCMTEVNRNALDLINRQQAEIKRLKKEQQQFADIGKMYSEVRAEAIKEFAERLKKQIPKKPDTKITNRGIDVTGEYDIDSDYLCSVCGCVVGDCEIEEHWYEYCPACGQALDWSDTE